MKFIEKYKQTLDNIRLLSKISSFLIAVIVFLEIFENLYTWTYLAETEWVNQYWNRIFLSFAFQFLMALIFTIRFILLWIKGTKFIWLSQIVWLSGWLTIYSYQLVTAKIYFGSFFGSRQSGCVDCMYYDTFLWASNGLFVMLFTYFLFSPIKQIMILIYAPFSKLERKHTNNLRN